MSSPSWLLCYKSVEQKSSKLAGTNVGATNVLTRKVFMLLGEGGHGPALNEQEYKLFLIKCILAPSWERKELAG